MDPDDSGSVVYCGRLMPDFAPILVPHDGRYYVSFMIPGFHCDLIIGCGCRRRTITPKTWSGDPRIPPQLQRDYISEQHVGTEPLVHGAFSSSPHVPNYLWTDCTDPQFWKHLYDLGLFTLPSDQYPFTFILVPNPEKKFAIHMSPGTVNDWNWSRKMRSVVSNYDFVVMSSVQTCGSVEKMKQELRESLTACAEFHTLRSSTWINEIFIENSCSLVGSGDVDYHVFKLADKVSGGIVAISIGYKHLRSFMDFTAATFVRSSASLGKILMYMQGDYLRNTLGVKLWYLGFKLPYMESLVRAVSIDNSNLTAKEFDRQEFQALWSRS